MRRAACRTVRRRGDDRKVVHACLDALEKGVLILRLVWHCAGMKAKVVVALIGMGLLVSGGVVAAEAKKEPGKAARTPAQRLEELGGRLKEEKGKVVEIDFRKSAKLRGNVWQLIGTMKDCRKLTVYGGARGLNDNTVKHLAGMAKLESLATDGAQLSDKGVAKLAALKNLRSAAFFHLSFRMKGFTGKGFASWKAMPKLERLTVAGMTMGDEGFKAIAQISSLKELRTWHTYRTEASNKEIAKLPNLSALRLGQRLPRGKGMPLSISDKSIPTLAGIKTLQRLEIGETHFTVDALEQLKKLPDLKGIKIYNTQLTEADVEQLRKRLPKLKITFEPQTEGQKKKLEAYLR